MVALDSAADPAVVVRSGHVKTPHADACLPGITRKTVLTLSASLGLPTSEARLSLSEFHCADEVGGEAGQDVPRSLFADTAMLCRGVQVFTTGSCGELTPVIMIDGLSIGTGSPGPVTRQLQAAYHRLTETEGVPLPF